MNTQIHEATGSSPYELVFGQKPRSVLFPSEGKPSVVLEEDLEGDGVTLDASNGEADKRDEESGAKQESGKDSAEGKEDKDREGSAAESKEDEDEKGAEGKGHEDGKDVSGDEGKGHEDGEDVSGDKRTRSLATMEKHLKVS